MFGLSDFLSAPKPDTPLLRRAAAVNSEKIRRLIISSILIMLLDCIVLLIGGLLLVVFILHRSRLLCFLPRFPGRGESGQASRINLNRVRPCGFILD
jgi:hypothetical protein